MSQAVLKPSEYITASERELRRWPGVTARREHLSRHARMVLTFNGQSRCVTYPLSPSDRRGPMNHVGDIRKALLEMGATRLPDPRSANPKRHRNRTEPKRVRLGEKAVKDPSRDCWAVLGGLDFKTYSLPPIPELAPSHVFLPATPSFWSRLLTHLGFHRKDTQP